MSGKFSGVIAAVPTPFTDAGTPDLELFLEHCLWSVNHGCNGLNILGTTGEANSQDTRSREAVMRAVAAVDFGAKPLMVGTGTPSLAETIRLSGLAADLEYDAALILPPYYYKPLTHAGLFAYFSEIVKSVKNRDIEIYLYNFPQMTGIAFPIEVVERLLRAFPNHIKGMKDSSGDLDYSKKIATAFAGRLSVFPSSEVCLPDAKRDGFSGCISASVNVTAPYAARAWSKGGKLASDEGDQLKQLREDIASVPIVAAIKTLVAMRSGKKAWIKMLPPLISLTDKEIASIKPVADKLGYS